MSVSAHPVSRLRLIKLATRTGESDRERTLRERRMELQAWNHQYWLANNSEFNQLKKHFVKHELRSLSADKDDLLNNANQTHEELALFYKRFLDANRSRHIAYNFEWYRRNLSLLWPSFVVQVERLILRR